MKLPKKALRRINAERATVEIRQSDRQDIKGLLERPGRNQGIGCVPGRSFFSLEPAMIEERLFP
jgi:hypothetical protein